MQFEVCDNKDILVSIIVPVYNTELYLEKCIDSILNQRHSNLEIWLILIMAQVIKALVYAINMPRKTEMFMCFIRKMKDTLSYGKDIAEGIASIIGNEKAVGEIFHIVQNKSYQWRTILEIYLSTLEKVIGKRPKLVLTEKCTNLQLD